MNDFNIELLAERLAEKLSETRHEDDKFVDKIVAQVSEQVVVQVSEKIICCNPTAYEEKFGVTPTKQRDLMQKTDRWFQVLEDSKSIVRRTVIGVVIVGIIGATIIGMAFNFNQVIDKIPK